MSNKRGTRALSLIINEKLLPKSKRSQLTIFIIVAIILVASVALFFAFKDELNINLSSVKNEPVYLFTQECIKETGKDSLFFNGQHSGYLEIPELSNDLGIAYYYYNNKNYMPSKKQLENQVSKYMNKMLFFCTQNFVDFPDLEIGQGNISTETKIENEQIIFNVKYPLTIHKENSTIRLENFNNIKISARLGIIYNSIEEMIQEQSQYENICLSCITETAIENDLKIDMMNLENNEIIFTIRDEYSKINDVALEFKFANKYP